MTVWLAYMIERHMKEEDSDILANISKILENVSLFMFSRSGNPLLTFLQSYLVRVTSKI